MRDLAPTYAMVCPCLCVDNCSYPQGLSTDLLEWRSEQPVPRYALLVWAPSFAPTYACVSPFDDIRPLFMR